MVSGTNGLPLNYGHRYSYDQIFDACTRIKIRKSMMLSVHKQDLLVMSSTYLCVIRNLCFPSKRSSKLFIVVNCSFLVGYPAKCSETVHAHTNKPTTNAALSFDLHERCIFNTPSPFEKLHDCTIECLIHQRAAQKFPESGDLHLNEFLV